MPPSTHTPAFPRKISLGVADCPDDDFNCIPTLSLCLEEDDAPKCELWYVMPRLDSYQKLIFPSLSYPETFVGKTTIPVGVIENEEDMLVFREMFHSTSPWGSGEFIQVFLARLSGETSLLVPLLEVCRALVKVKEIRRRRRREVMRELMAGRRP
ncbi:hypothetical protein BDW74DRAFT_181243 [Aspergillus multicolor]|uniref:uncharacterized protein n=1 Tax=Aspergillus multicolor TaxID=41759 RepID=UPI003CCE111F